MATRLILPEMVAAGHGHIINVASYAATYRWPLVSGYSASKAAIVRFSESLAQETRRHGISVFNIDPGLLPIGLSKPALESNAEGATPEARIHKWIRDQLAMGRGADPKQAVRLVLTLAGGRADRLSEGHLSVRNNIDILLADIAKIERDDLRTLRLRTANCR